MYSVDMDLISRRSVGLSENGKFHLGFLSLALLTFFSLS